MGFWFLGFMGFWLLGFMGFWFCLIELSLLLYSLSDNEGRRPLRPLSSMRKIPEAQGLVMFLFLNSGSQRL